MVKRNVSALIVTAATFAALSGAARQPDDPSIPPFYLIPCGELYRLNDDAWCVKGIRAPHGIATGAELLAGSKGTSFERGTAYIVQFVNPPFNPASYEREDLADSVRAIGRLQAKYSDLVGIVLFSSQAPNKERDAKAKLEAQEFAREFGQATGLRYYFDIPAAPVGNGGVIDPKHTRNTLQAWLQFLRNDVKAQGALATDPAHLNKDAVIIDKAGRIAWIGKFNKENTETVTYSVFRLGLTERKGDAEGGAGKGER